MATPRLGSRGNVQFAELPSPAGDAVLEQASDARRTVHKGR